MAPKYKLIYFNLPARAEPIRYIFAYAGQDYDDVRIKFREWPELKSKTPFGQVPVLEIDGKPVAESKAIARYLAKQFNLLGANDWDNLQADAYVDALESVVQNLFGLLKESDPSKIADIKRQVASYLKKFDEIIANNPSGLLVGSKGITWADLTFAASLADSIKNDLELFKPFPRLTKLVHKINDLPSIKAWLQKRPKSDPLP